jgi:predicted choloylglycine hydrolase
MYGINEANPGPRWRALFEATWPAYRRWYLSEGPEARSSVREAGKALARHMPELLPTWARWSEQTGYDDMATAMLAQWRLPAFAPAGCSQVVVLDPTPTLLRNYDYHPDLFECVSISTAYLQPVIGTGDCLSGLLDGMNRAGLAVSLTFGGDRRTGVGFGIPLVVRYLLEVCDDVAAAQEALRGLPVAMTYNLTMVDRTGLSATAHVGPGRAPEFRDQPVATNHRWDRPVDPQHAARYRSVERYDRLQGLVDRRATPATITDDLLRTPLHSRDYDRAFGTLYTAAYEPVVGRLEYRWPRGRWVRRFDSPDEVVTVDLDGALAPAA